MHNCKITVTVVYSVHFKRRLWHYPFCMAFILVCIFFGACELRLLSAVSEGVCAHGIDRGGECVMGFRSVGI